MKKILAAIDFSNATPGVIQAAIDLTQAFGAELHLLHVVEPEPTYTAYGLTPGEFPAIQAFHIEARTRAKNRLDATVAEITEQGITPIAHLSDGSPLIELEAKTKELDADFVILGSHGHNIVTSLILGSVAEGMVRKAIAPTLVIPATNP